MTLKVRSTVSSEEVSYNNTDVVEYRVENHATHIFEALVEDYANLEFGYIYAEVNVMYGSFEILVKDAVGLTTNYEPIVIVVENATTGEIIAKVTAYEHTLSMLPAGTYRIKVLFKNIVVAEGIFNLTTSSTGSIFEIISNVLKLPRDYRGIERSIIAPKHVVILGYTSESTKYPFSRMRLLLNGTGSFVVFINYRGDLPTKVVVEGNVTGLKYYWDGSYLVIEGSLGSTGEINVTDLYRLRVEMYDRLGNLMPSWVYAYINETKYSGAIVEDYYYPDDYVVKLPTTINGFVFYSFFDGFNESIRAVSLNNTDITLKVWYRVPTSIELKSYQVSSMSIIPFIKQEGETVKVYFEGYLKDYYGNGVPNRPLVINITNVETGYMVSYNVTTDVAGYFRSPVVELFRGKSYRIEVIYNGDDVYVGTLSTSEVKPEELPVAPTVIEIPVNYLLAAVGVALIAFGVFAALRAARHTVEDLRERSRRFVRKKR